MTRSISICAYIANNDDLISAGITLVPVSCVCTFIEIRRICLQFRTKTKTDTLPSIRALAEKEGFELETVRPILSKTIKYVAFRL